MTYTAKLVKARDRIKALAKKKRIDAKRMDDMHVHDAEMTCRAEARGMEVTVRVIEDLLQD